MPLVMFYSHPMKRNDDGFIKSSTIKDAKQLLDTLTPDFRLLAAYELDVNGKVTEYEVVFEDGHLQCRPKQPSPEQPSPEQAPHPLFNVIHQMISRNDVIGMDAIIAAIQKLGGYRI